MKKGYLGKIVLILLFVLLIIFSIKIFVKDEKSVTIGKAKFKVEVVKTAEEKEKGLAGHKPLKEDEGMLFEFPKGDGYGFWMKGMTFPIDIVWITNNKVIYLVENAQPPSTEVRGNELEIFTPPSPAEYVLEVRAEGVKKYGIGVEDGVLINL